MVRAQSSGPIAQGHERLPTGVRSDLPFGKVDRRIGTGATVLSKELFQFPQAQFLAEQLTQPLFVSQGEN